MKTYGRYPIVPVRGEGCRVWDADGKMYLDFLAGVAVNNLGHCHPKVVEAIRKQAATLIVITSYSIHYTKLYDGFKTRFHLYTVPGQVFYDASRKLILKGVDGVVFVADSQEERLDANIESMESYNFV